MLECQFYSFHLLRSLISNRLAKTKTRFIFKAYYEIKYRKDIRYNPDFIGSLVF
jgi:hypothetical protein